jgi:hypothetical protein
MIDKYLGLCQMIQQDISLGTFMICAMKPGCKYGKLLYMAFEKLKWSS